ncbi:MAG: DUF4838 domain-containing protein, partial [Phycisphaeraceae bacterium]
DYFLDRHMGVRWLWPGEAGTHVPRHETVAVPALDVRERPTLEQRVLWTHLHRRRFDDSQPLLLDAAQYEQLKAEHRAWERRHQLGSQSRFDFGHAFGQWWQQYRDEHADYFAVPPEGQSQPHPNANRVKLCVSNPAVVERVVREWREAGAPDNWNVCPNDGAGFCVCDDCRALDAPAMQDPSAVWEGRANLTGRYVHFWNALLAKMRPINPDVRLSAYAYSAYRDAPSTKRELAPGMVLGVVDSFEAYDSWRAWHDAGASLFLRPNWWHMGAVAPHLLLHEQGRFFQFAREHGMVGFKFDSLMGYWGTQGVQYYLIARLSARPDLGVDDVIEEYCAAFGDAAPQIRQYIEYWEDHAQRVAFSVPAGGAAPRREAGLYARLLEETGQEDTPLLAAWRLMGTLYDDAALAPAARLLDEAMTRADNPRARERVRFLQDGLAHMRLVRDVLALGYRAGTLSAQERARYHELAARLQQMRAELTPRHVVWGERLNWTEARRRIPTAPAMPFLGRALGGPWHIRFDPHDEGVERQWHAAAFDAEAWTPIEVGRHWHDQGVGEDYFGTAWYHTRFTLDEPIGAHETIALHFGGVDEQAWVYVNGQLVGEHTTESENKGIGELWDEPFTIRLRRDQLNVDEPNTLVVRVHASTGKGGIWRGVLLEKSTENLLTNGDFSDGLDNWPLRDRGTGARTTSMDDEPFEGRIRLATAPGKHFGGRSIRIEKHASDLADMIGGTEATFTPGTYLCRTRYRMRPAADSDDAYISVRMSFRRGESKTDVWHRTPSGPAEQWTTASKAFELEETCDRVIITVFLRDKATFWLDELALEKAPAEMLDGDD